MKDWLEKMNDALNYIEDNLDGHIDMEEVARQACCSNFNFQRMFSFITDISIGEYIRRRRLSMAGMELLESKVKIIHVAMKYGYNSPVSFTRAFYAVHGVNPSDVKKPGVKIKAYPPISFQISIKGVESMNYRIEEFGKFRLVGYKKRMNLKNEENFGSISEFWNEICTSGKCESMMRYNDNQNLCCMGVCAHGDEEGFDYYIATGSSKGIPEGMCELIVPASTYVIFECIGKLPEGQQNVWKRIFTEWFPASNYKIEDGPQMEWYSEGDMDSEDYRSEIWIPVNKK